MLMTIMGRERMSSQGISSLMRDLNLSCRIASLEPAMNKKQLRSIPRNKLVALFIPYNSEKSPFTKSLNAGKGGMNTSMMKASLKANLLICEVIKAVSDCMVPRWNSIMR
jgi:hypothetical protein